MDVVPLAAMATIPSYFFKENSEWGEGVYVVPEYSFAVDVSRVRVHLGHEHDSVQWLPYEEASDLFTFDSNRTALWEIDQRIKDGTLS